MPIACRRHAKGAAETPAQRFRCKALRPGPLPQVPGMIVTDEGRQFVHPIVVGRNHIARSKGLHSAIRIAFGEARNQVRVIDPKLVRQAHGWRQRQVQYLGPVRADAVQVRLERTVDRDIPRTKLKPARQTRFAVASGKDERDVTMLMPMPWDNAAPRQSLTAQVG